MSSETRDVGSRLKGIPISLIALLLLAVTLSLGELAARISGSEMIRWFMPYFGVAYATWTYVFFYDDGYRFSSRSRRVLMFVGLSILGFGLMTWLYPVPAGAEYRLLMPIVLSIPAIIELIRNRPVFRKTPP